MTVERHVFDFGPFRIDLADRRLLRGGMPLPLTPKAFTTLVALARGEGRLVTKRRLQEEVWGDSFVEEGALARNIADLRKALGETARAPRYIETVPRLGYRLRGLIDGPGRQRSADPVPAVPATPHQGAERAYMAVLFASLPGIDAAPEEGSPESLSVAAAWLDLACALASRYGSRHQVHGSDGIFLLFERAEAAVRCGLRLLEVWAQRRVVSTGAAAVPDVRLGCVFLECQRLTRSRLWLPSELELVRDVAAAGEAGGLHVLEPVLDLLERRDCYQVAAAGRRPVGRRGEVRSVERVVRFDAAAAAARRRGDLGAEEWFLRGVGMIGTERENGDAEEACYREALRRRVEHAEARNNLGALLRRRGRPSEAAEQYREALRLRPEYPEAHYNYALLLAAGGRTAGAIEHFRAALRTRPDFVPALLALARVHHERGKHDPADALYRRALELRPGSAEIHNNYAVFLHATDDELAGRHLRRAIELRPEYAEAHYNLGLVADGRGDRAGAERLYAEAVRLRPDYPEARNNLAALLFERGDLPGARRHYSEALLLRPEDPELHFNYALVLDAAGETRAAAEHRRTARDLAPDQARFHTAIDVPR